MRIILHSGARISSEDILKDGRKQYENGLPEDGDISLLPPTVWGSVVPQNQSLVYAFASSGDARTNQDVGFDGYDDFEEAQQFDSFSELQDPSNDNYTYFLNTQGNIFERYKGYNGLEGNSPETITDTNRGSTTQPDVEDINQDNTMNTIDSYFEYELDITPASLANLNNKYIVDQKEKNITLPNGTSEIVKWYQFRIPINEPSSSIGGISDFRSVRFIRMLLNNFTQNTILRLGTLDLVRSDWRKYQLALDEEINNDNDNTDFSVGIVCQLILLPIVAFIIILIIRLPIEIALGLMIIAAAPGGVTSNVLTKFANGDVALSISLTAIGSLISIISVPFIVFKSADLLGVTEMSKEITMTGIAIKMALVVTIPVIIGMIIRFFANNFVTSNLKVINKITGFLFLIVFIAVWIEERENILNYLSQAGIAVITLNIIMMVLAFYIAKFFASGSPQKKCIALECGLQNGTLAVFVATQIFDNVAYVVPTAAYALIMYITGFIFIYILKEKN